MSPASSIIQRNPQILAGQPVFAGSRVPVEIFWDYLQGGYSMDEFLAQYPTVKRDQCTALLAIARDEVMNDARAA